VGEGIFWLSLKFVDEVYLVVLKEGREQLVVVVFKVFK
jgi:hypothetical protein